MQRSVAVRGSVGVIDKDGGGVGVDVEYLGGGFRVRAVLILIGQHKFVFRDVVHAYVADGWFVGEYKGVVWEEGI